MSDSEFFVNFEGLLQLGLKLLVLTEKCSFFLSLAKKVTWDMKPTVIGNHLIPNKLADNSDNTKATSPENGKCNDLLYRGPIYSLGLINMKLHSDCKQVRVIFLSSTEHFQKRVGLWR